jgi:hypothetical protein
MRLTPRHLAVVAVLSPIAGTALQVSSQATPSKADQLGEVHFSVSCSGEAQAKFHRAIALYHSFDWKRGQVAFEEIATLDPRCAMAHWGLAMVAAEKPFGWPVGLKLQEGAEAAQQAKGMGALTPRERAYISGEPSTTCALKVEFPLSFHVACPWKSTVEEVVSTMIPPYEGRRTDSGMPTV